MIVPQDKLLDRIGLAKFHLDLIHINDVGSALDGHLHIYEMIRVGEDNGWRTSKSIGQACQIECKFYVMDDVDVDLSKQYTMRLRIDHGELVGYYQAEVALNYVDGDTFIFDVVEYHYSGTSSSVNLEMIADLQRAYHIVNHLLSGHNYHRLTEVGDILKKYIK